MYPLENNKNVNIQLYYVYTIIHIIFNYIFCCGGVWCSGVLWGDYKVQSNNILTLKKNIANHSITCIIIFTQD